MDRGEEELVIESLTVKGGEQSSLNDERERALLARENLTLLEPVSATFWDEIFMQQAESEAAGPIKIQEPEESPEEESPKVTIEPTPELSPELTPELEATLSISVTSPNSGATIPKDAFAIEGQVLSGTASKVTVTWSGNGEPFALGLFEPGSASFRYVADVDYLNLAQGSNTYTIVAYDAAGNASNTVTLTIVASF